MKDWHAFKKFQAWWMSDDRKPKGKIKRSIKRSANSKAKREIEKEVKHGRDK